MLAVGRTMLHQVLRIPCLQQIRPRCLGKMLHLHAKEMSPCGPLLHSNLQNRFQVEEQMQNRLAAAPGGSCSFEPQIVKLHTSTRQQVLEDRSTKSLTVWSNVREIKSSPIPALSLGLSGLIPFVAVPAYMIMSQMYIPNLAFVQVAYGASILSFLGGVRWGFVLPEENPMQPDWINLGYSITPSLIAWGGLMLPHPLSLFTMMGGLTAATYADMAMYGYPPWFKGLRFLLSFVAILSLWTTFMCSFMLTKKEPSSKSKEPVE